MLTMKCSGLSRVMEAPISWAQSGTEQSTKGIPLSSWLLHMPGLSLPPHTANMALCGVKGGKTHLF